MSKMQETSSQETRLMEGISEMTIPISYHDFKKQLGIKRILEQKRFCYKNDEKQREEIAICYGINDSEFKVTITDLTQHKKCSKCKDGEEVYHYRLLNLTFETISSAEQSYKKMLRMAGFLKKAGGSKK